MENVHLRSIDIGGGLVATDAWFSEGGPIVLIGTRNPGQVERKSRLDLQKAMFIDPLPGARSVEGVRQVVEAVKAAGSRSGR